MSENKIKPSDFMRARRPELYTDSVFANEPTLNRSQLEFHLDTLTQRKEETRFEHFCRKLAEKEICPNLLPQTGPTGGGDSKTDSETYPVADSISALWYIGDPQRASQERWAFAFSAKKTWQSKIIDDVKKIVETGRGYSLIYFITNQSVSDRKRAESEDKLSQEFGLPVRILDRTWIVEKVIDHRRWDVVYQTLDIDVPRSEHKHQIGPADLERSRELEELDRQIEDANRYQGTEYQLIEDCLQTALLSRGLGRPRTEVDGRFARAERLTKDRKNSRQLFRVLYHKAWTAYWWYDDFAELDRIYMEAEPLALESDLVWVLEKLVNLWQIQKTARFINHQIKIDEQRWDDHTSKLRNALLLHAANVDKPTSALWARTQLILMDLADAAIHREHLPSVFEKIMAILKEADGHLDYPVDTLIRIVQELGEFVGNSEAYDELFEAAIELQSKRSSSAEEGNLRLDRGFHKLRSGKTYDAIEQFARAQTLLAQDEIKGDCLQAIAGTALAYESAGLLWAARANLVFALDRSLYEHFKEGRIDPQALPLLRKLIWVELQLGRIPCVFLWIEWLNLISSALLLEESARDNLKEEFQLMDTILGILMLRTNHSDWPRLDRVAALLERLSLLMSRGAALFALGYEDAFRLEYELADQDLDTFFSLWLEQPAAKDLPPKAEWHIGRTITMRTVIMGCKIELISENRTTSILLGEAIMAFLESFFSTTIKLKGHFSLNPYLKIELKQSTNADVPFNHKILEDEYGESHIMVTHACISADQMVRNANYEHAFRALLSGAIEQLQIQFSIESLELLFAKERAQDRAFLVAQSPLSVTNVLSLNPKYHIENLIADDLKESLAPLRASAWQAKTIKVTEDDANKDTPFKLSDQQPPDGLFGVDGLKHSDLVIYSPINMPLWDKARWRGLGFAACPGTPPIPELALMFENLEAGIKIFRGWQKRLGMVDQKEWINLTIITGIDRNHPFHYRVAINANADLIGQEKGSKGQFMMACRMQDMTPANSTNLDRFIALFKRAGRFRLSLARMENSRLIPYQANEFFIEKHNLRLIPAWQIGPEDPASLALGGIENPVIPPNIVSPPFFKNSRNKTA